MPRDNQNVTDIVMHGFITTFLVKRLIISMDGIMEALQALRPVVLLIIYMIVPCVRVSTEFMLRMQLVVIIHYQVSPLPTHL